MESVQYLRFKEGVRPYLKMLKKASDTIIDQGVSKHPIFVLHRQEVELGIELAKHDQVSGQWSVNASTLEEFVAKNLIEPAKVEAFKQTFKDPETHLCLFVINEGDADFVFIPKELSGAN